MANGHGGVRPGSGRKTKAEILGLAELIDSAWPVADQKKVIRKLALDCNAKDFHIRNESRKLLLAYKFGKPTESIKHSGDSDNPLMHKVVVEVISQ